MNRLYYKRLYNREYNTDGVDVMAEDWDTLVVLDACRYDLFRDHHTLPGSLSRRESRGSHTSEFIFGNFHGREFPDAVYVTASPILQRGLGRKYETSFHDVVNVWAEDGWNEEHNTVLAGTMTEYAIEAAERYPHKRLVVHYMQPHFPFVGVDFPIEGVTVPDPAVIETDIWMRLMTDTLDVPHARVRDAYGENLTRAMPAVERLLGELDGKVVVTSDHGNMLGERASPVPVREWGHPPGVYTPELVTVPWLEYDAGPRPAIQAGETGDMSAVEDDVVADRLRHLGYAE